VFSAEAPFRCPPGAGQLQRQDLKKLFKLIGNETNASDPETGLWVFHLQFRLARALGGQAAERYIELIRQVKSGAGTEAHLQELRTEMKTMEDLALPPAKCGHCHTPESTTTTLLCCVRCMSEKYCGKQCQKSAWPKHRKNCEQVKSPVLENAQEWQRRLPASFSDVPSQAFMREVQKDMRITVAAPTGRAKPERMWVLVDTVLAWPKFIGRVGNNPVDTNIHGIKKGDRIKFEWENAFQIDFPLNWKSPLA